MFVRGKSRCLAPIDANADPIEFCGKPAIGEREAAGHSFALCAEHLEEFDQDTDEDDEIATVKRSKGPRPTAAKTPARKTVARRTPVRRRLNKHKDRKAAHKKV